MDILWPRWVARIGVTRSTQACFLAADRQCTELPLLRLPRLVHGFRGSDPMRQTRDLARVGWRGLAPFLPIGPHERPRLADSFSRLGQARGASPGSLDQRSEEWPLCEGKSGALDASVRPSEGGRELRGPHGRLSSALPLASFVGKNFDTRQDACWGQLRDEAVCSPSRHTLDR